jgi:hypothetical protein
MERITVNVPSPVLNKIRKYAHKNDLSLSSSVVKLVEFALAIEAKKNEKSDESKQESDQQRSFDMTDPGGNINKTINELIIQNAIILKEILHDGFNFDDKKIEEIKAKVNKARSSILNKSP